MLHQEESGLWASRCQDVSSSRHRLCFSEPPQSNLLRQTFLATGGDYDDIMSLPSPYSLHTRHCISSFAPEIWYFQILCTSYPIVFTGHKDNCLRWFSSHILDWSWHFVQQNRPSAYKPWIPYRSDRTVWYILVYHHQWLHWCENHTAWLTQAFSWHDGPQNLVGQCFVVNSLPHHWHFLTKLIAITHVVQGSQSPDHARLSVHFYSKIFVTMFHDVSQCSICVILLLCITTGKHRLRPLIISFQQISNKIWQPAKIDIQSD